MHDMPVAHPRTTQCEGKRERQSRNGPERTPTPAPEDGSPVDHGWRRAVRRVAYRFVMRTIRRAAESEMTLTARCLANGCKWSVGPTAELEVAQDACLVHAEQQGEAHSRFSRVTEDVGEVVHS
ncbi:DUF7848 domain-containing protein [Streptomyces sp. NBC_00483]|uniref:DUF7848 domain-containing protein n=1 Tax=Streptomyces sp. NBC_00483 TaxID=2975756 RepID=UPI003FCC9555